MILKPFPINFEDTKDAYILKSNNDLRLAKFLFSVLQKPALSGLGRSFLKFAIDAKLPVNGPVKATLYKHFIGGESAEKMLPLMRKMRGVGVSSILDYSLEGIETEAEFERNVEEFLRNVELAGKYREIPFSVFKPSAIATHRVLEKYGNGDMTLADKEEFERVRERFHKIFSRASELGVRVMVDAEESWLQKAIDDLFNEMMLAYNKERAIAMNTFQMYRKDRLDFLKESFELARSNGVKLGAKLVRGAYMEKERARADKMGYESPINETKLDSDLMYDEAVQYCIEHLDEGEVFIGTHNEQSVSNALITMHHFNIMPHDDRVWFSQLYGMCDYISFNIAKHGFNVAKYVPYGPVKSVIPYLLRRADENSSVAGQAVKELRLINTELKRRENGE